MNEVIFTTVHGSRLYGFEHEGSDYDTFTVTDSTSPRAKQRIVGDHNHFEIGIHRFLDLAMSGSHQSVEAMFSPEKKWAVTEAARKWRPLIEGARVGGSEVFDKYERTIRKFCYGDFKRRRHAVRLRYDLADLRQFGKLKSVRTSAPMVQLYSMIASSELDGDGLARQLGVYKSRGGEREDTFHQT